MLLLMIAVSAAHAQPPADTYCNPLDVLVADPFIYRQGSTYYLYGTASESGLLVWTSDNLVDWRLRGFAFHRTRRTWARHSFWAPEMFKYHDKYYLHFTAVGGNEERRIVLSEADSPLGPFHEIKAPWFEPGQSTIDSDVFQDDDGKLYLYSVYTGDNFNKRFRVEVRRLNSDLVPDAHETLCITPTLKWEEGIVNEGPFVMKHDGTYFLTYSAVGYMSPNYCVGLATAKSPLGPWKKQASGPILYHTKTVSGPGHHCFIDSPDHREMFIAYHTHQFIDQPGPPRQLAIDRAHFVDGPNPTIVVGPATDTPQPMPSGAPKLVRGQNDEFNGDVLDRKRWTVFSEGIAPRPHWRLGGGRLTIDTENGDVFETRSDLSNLFLEYAPFGDFTVTTSVAVKPEQDYQQAFLMLWQDHNNYAKIAFLHSHGKDKIEVAISRNEKVESRLHDTALTDHAFLRIIRRGDSTEFDDSGNGREWQMIDTLKIPMLDLRVGLGACSPSEAESGAPSIPAAFDFIRFDKVKSE